MPAGVVCWRGRDDNGAHILVARPAGWNGRLVVHIHGGPRMAPPGPRTSDEDLVRFAEFVADGWAFADTTRTTAEILVAHYRNIHASSGRAAVLAAVDDRAGHHVRKGLQRPFFAGRQTHLTDVDKGRSIHGGDSPLARDVLQDGIDDGINILRTEHVSLCKGGHIVFRFCHGLHPPSRSPARRPVLRA